MLLAFVFWTGIGLLFSTQIYLLWDEATWTDAMREAMPRWYLWGLLTPLIIGVSRRLPRRWPLSKRLLVHVPLGLLWTGAFVVILYGIRQGLGGTWPVGIGPFFVQNVYLDVLVYALIVGGHVAWDYAAEARRREVEAARLETQAAQLGASLTDARLRALQAQLNPHFLFNALNAISAFTERAPQTARRMMAELGDLLRASLDHADRQEVPLGEELGFLEHYLAIERLRFEDRLTVTVEAGPDVRRALVPSFLLQPLVENAIRHGTGARVQRGHIRVEARREGDRLALRVEDDGAGLPDAWRLEDHGGVGLLNTARRLEELYGTEQRFAVEGAPGAGVQVRISLPFRETPSRLRRRPDVPLTPSDAAP